MMNLLILLQIMRMVLPKVLFHDPLNLIKYHFPLMKRVLNICVFSFDDIFLLFSPSLNMLFHSFVPLEYEIMEDEDQDEYEEEQYSDQEEKEQKDSRIDGNEMRDQDDANDDMEMKDEEENDEETEEENDEETEEETEETKQPSHEQDLLWYFCTCCSLSFSYFTLFLV